MQRTIDLRPPVSSPNLDPDQRIKSKSHFRARLAFTVLPSSQIQARTWNYTDQHARNKLVCDEF